MEIFQKCTYMLSGIALSGSANRRMIRTRSLVDMRLPEHRPAPPWAARLGRSGGSGMRPFGLQV